MRLAVDPDLRTCGLALGDSSGRLVKLGAPPNRAEGDRAQVWLGVASTVADFLGGATLARLVLEYPRTYGGRASRGDTNDLIALAAVVGCLTATIKAETVSVVTPTEYKGQLPKKIAHERARARLSASELALVPRLSKAASEDMWDAIYLFLWDVRRI